MTKPTIHLNGTAGSDLKAGYLAGMVAVSAAADALSESFPNGRDYYPQGDDAIRSATAEHRSRLERLEAIREELEALAMSVIEQMNRR